MPTNKTLRIIHGEIKTPPMSSTVRIKSGVLLRQLQEEEMLTAPVSKPMQAIGSRCYELRIPDKAVTWRIIYRIDESEIVVAEIFVKKTQKTPQSVIQNCTARYKAYDKRREEGK